MTKDLLAQWSQLQRKLAGFHHGGPDQHSIWAPNTDVYDSPDGLVVKIELAGVSPGNVQVLIEDGALIVQGIRRDPYCGATVAGYRFRQMEIEYGMFRRIVRMPYDVDARAAKARFEGGILEIQLPRAAKAPARKIKVSIEN